MFGVKVDSKLHRANLDFIAVFDFTVVSIINSDIDFAESNIEIVEIRFVIDFNIRAIMEM